MWPRNTFSLAETVFFPQTAARWWCCSGCIPVDKAWHSAQNPFNTHNKRIWGHVGDKHKIHKIFYFFNIYGVRTQIVGSGKAKGGNNSQDVKTKENRS